MKCTSGWCTSRAITTGSVRNTKTFRYIVCGFELLFPASLPGMFERTVTLGAAEKSFGVTGWQIGWAYGPGTLLKKLQTLHQRVVYNASTPLQIAFAKMLETEARVSYFDEMANELRDKRDYLVQMLFKTKMEPILPEGGMFVLADVSEIASRVDLSGESGEFVDMKFVNWLARCHGLQAFPVTVFCAETGRKKRENLVRFCFAKKRQTLEEAALVLSKFELAPAL
ncbi:unnamed protein product [Phyllotreta striolata]|uniref:kynurenine--oxoglutarate transaminase n=1 Tax=Phyllotreta striolata TaxID=444603 RepID=A0A9N9TX25_PHYSR|nr:unnamed protein product [Phyllotreta striolata]